LFKSRATEQLVRIVFICQIKPMNRTLLRRFITATLWAQNGGDSFKDFLTEIASHGFLAIAIGQK
jgi:hypothetical protein